MASIKSFKVSSREKTLREERARRFAAESGRSKPAQRKVFAHRAADGAVVHNREAAQQKFFLRLLDSGRPFNRMQVLGYETLFGTAYEGPRTDDAAGVGAGPTGKTASPGPSTRRGVDTSDGAFHVPPSLPDGAMTGGGAGSAAAPASEEGSRPQEDSVEAAALSLMSATRRSKVVAKLSGTTDAKQRRALLSKALQDRLEQVSHLEVRMATGLVLGPEEQDVLASRTAVVRALEGLGAPLYRRTPSAHRKRALVSERLDRELVVPRVGGGGGGGGGGGSRGTPGGKNRSKSKSKVHGGNGRGKESESESGSWRGLDPKRRPAAPALSASASCSGSGSGASVGVIAGSEVLGRAGYGLGAGSGSGSGSRSRSRSRSKEGAQMKMKKKSPFGARQQSDGGGGWRSKSPASGARLACSPKGFSGKFGTGGSGSGAKQEKGSSGKK